MFFVFLVDLSKATLRCYTSICDGIIFILWLSLKLGKTFVIFSLRNQNLGQCRYNIFSWQHGEWWWPTIYQASNTKPSILKAIVKYTQIYFKKNLVNQIEKYWIRSSVCGCVALWQRIWGRGSADSRLGREPGPVVPGTGDSKDNK